MCGKPNNKYLEKLLRQLVTATELVVCTFGPLMENIHDVFIDHISIDVIIEVTLQGFSKVSFTIPFLRIGFVVHDNGMIWFDYKRSAPFCQHLKSTFMPFLWNTSVKLFQLFDFLFYPLVIRKRIIFILYFVDIEPV